MSIRDNHHWLTDTQIIESLPEPVIDNFVRLQRQPQGITIIVRCPNCGDKISQSYSAAFRRKSPFRCYRHSQSA